MRRLRLGIPLAVVVLSIVLAVAFPAGRRLIASIRPGWSADKRYTLPNGWRLTPAGDTSPLPGDMPGNIIVLPSRNQALINTSGYHDHSLNLVDLRTGTITKTIPFKKSWVGLALVGHDVLVSGGQAGKTAADEAIHRVSLTDTLVPKNGFNLSGIEAGKQFVSSILPTPEGLVVVNIQTDEILLLDPQGAEKARARVGYRPYRCALSPSGKVLAVSNWGGKSVSLLDPRTLKTQIEISTRSMPSALLYSPDGRLFVTESGSNTVAVIKDDRVAERIRTGLDAKQPIGATPEALALSRDNKTLYVANAGNNCLTVIDISRAGNSRAVGLIPTERYPTAVALSEDGKKLIVTTAKGYYGPNAIRNDADSSAHLRKHPLGLKSLYIGDQLQGRIALINVPDQAQLRAWTRDCYLDRPLGISQVSSPAIRTEIQKGAFDKIKHVLYVIRENRAYDQVLGDIGKGESDSSLTLFGKKVTPNGHLIANSYTLLDNLYTDGEVSQAGHQWTDAAYANDYNEHQWVLDYSDRGEVESDDRITSSPGDYIWTTARKHGLKARVFGEYVSVQEDHSELTNPIVKADPEKFGFSAAFEKIFARGGRDMEKVDEFLGEMKATEKQLNWPNLMVMALPEDHTHGMSAGALSPYAMVADNDQAIGKLIEGISHSPYWKDTAVFVIEDDAQDGADHVDSHRTVGLVVSPYVRRNMIDSTMYSTSSMLRTMELILHLPPMTQYDADATPMYAAFTSKPNFEPYTTAPPEVDLNERNPAKTALARRSAKLDFTDIDRADPDEFNHILWEAYRPHEPYPATLR